MAKKYKIEVDRCDNGYVAVLFVRKWLFFWFVKELVVDVLPFGVTVLYWEEKYKIPAKRVIFNLPTFPVNK